MAPKICRTKVRRFLEKILPRRSRRGTQAWHGARRCPAGSLRRGGRSLEGDLRNRVILGICRCDAAQRLGPPPPPPLGGKKTTRVMPINAFALARRTRQARCRRRIRDGARTAQADSLTGI